MIIDLVARDHLLMAADTGSYPAIRNRHPLPVIIHRRRAHQFRPGAESTYSPTDRPTGLPPPPRLPSPSSPFLLDAEVVGIAASTSTPEGANEQKMTTTHALTHALTDARLSHKPAIDLRSRRLQIPSEDGSTSNSRLRRKSRESKSFGRRTSGEREREKERPG